MDEVRSTESLRSEAVPTAKPWDTSTGRVMRVPRGEWAAKGPPPRAVRIVRPGRTPSVVALVPGRYYDVGRIEQSKLWFDDETVSRKHASLFFEPEAATWVLRDTESSSGTFLAEANASGPPRRAPHWMPIGLAAGLTVSLGAGGECRLEFLEHLPANCRDSESEWKSPASMELERAVRRTSRLARAVFLLGPSGTGKTHAARSIHERSGAKGRFVYVNSGALPADALALQSEFLGHTAGAYTGAKSKRTGKLFEAQDGTLFLDEVESLVPEAQAFFLDLLEEGNHSLTPLGAESAHGLQRPQFRLISASKLPLAESPLRRDFAQRLALGELIRIPSLQERREDIPLLIERFLATLAKRAESLTAEVSEKALDFLMEQPWPGEVRELQATIQTVAERVADDIGPASEGKPLLLGVEDFRQYLVTREMAFGRRASPPVAAETVATFAGAPRPRKRPSDLKREEIQAALLASHNQKTHAARALGIALNTLKRRMWELGLSSESE